MLPAAPPDVPSIGRDRDVASPPALEFRDVSKSFPGTLAVDSVSLTVRTGEIHGLVGENGAGKTTLIKVLAGEYRPDSGEILLDGAPIVLNHPWDAMSHGIGFIHQEPALVPSLSVVENLTLGLGFQTHAPGLIDWGAERRRATELLHQVGLDVDPLDPLERLSVAERQLVAIARVLALRLRVVVFDEPTAPLTEAEVERLFAIIRKFRDAGAAVIYISHRLEEIFRLADRVTVMRNGRWVATRDVRELDPKTITTLIIGHDPSQRFAAATARARADGEVVLRVRGLEDKLLKGVTFDLHRGEILGLAGLAGSGRSNILEAIFGLRRLTRGEFSLDGMAFAPGQPADALAHGVALVTEERKKNGYVPGLPIWQHVTLPWLAHFSRSGLLRLGLERKAGEEAMVRFDIRARSVQSTMRELSGGNQQKAILARWLSQPLRVLLLDEPTHGVDVGAKEEIYRIIRELAEKGLPQVVISSDFDELKGLCDRVLILVEGSVIGELHGSEIDKPAILNALFTHKIEASRYEQ